MVDYYYSRWFEGRVHEVRLYPVSSDNHVAYTSPAFNLDGYPPQNPLKVGSHSTAILAGEEFISGGALSGMALRPFSNYMECRSLAGETRVDHMSLINEGGTPDDPGFNTTEPSAVAQARAFADLGGPPEALVDDTSTPWYSSISGGAGIYHYGWRREVNNAGFIGGLSGKHIEAWAVRSLSYMFMRYGYLIPNSTSFEASMSNWQYAPMDLGIAPPPDEWPEGVIRAEIEGDLRAMSQREFLEVRLEAWSAPGADDGTFKGGYADSTAWDGYYPDADINPNEVLGWQSIPYGSGSVDLPADELTEWRDTMTTGVAEQFRAWGRKILNFSFVPRPRDPSMASTLYPPGEGIGGIGSGEEVNDNVWDWMEETDIIGISQAHSDFIGHPDVFPPRPLDFSVYLKFRTPPYRYVYEVEPEITGRADAVRRRFT